MALLRAVDPSRLLRAAPLAWAAVALALGLGVYLLDRPAGHAALIPAAWSLAGDSKVFGAASGWLPSLLYTFAFSLLTALTLPRTTTAAVGSAALWWSLGIAFELLQHRVLGVPLAAALDGVPGLQALGRYALHGRFDPADLAALTAGAGAAAGLLILTRSRENRHDS